jgi:hypothetical protein
MLDFYAVKHEYKRKDSRNDHQQEVDVEVIDERVCINIVDIAWGGLNTSHF